MSLNALANQATIKTAIGLVTQLAQHIQAATPPGTIDEVLKKLVLQELDKVTGFIAHLLNQRQLAPQPVAIPTIQPTSAVVPTEISTPETAV
jgi:hypothetical protein